MYQRDFEVDKKKVYERDREFKYFEGIRDRLEYIKTQAKNFLDNNRGIDGFTLYRRTILFLGSPIICNILPTYDEKIAFLIHVVDPNLDIYQKYIGTEIIGTKEINGEDEERQKELLEQRKQQIMELGASLRDTFGFYDSKLLNYEACYFKKIRGHFKIINGVKQNYFDHLMILAHQVKDFSGVSDERFEKVNTKAMFYASKAEDTRDLNTVAFNLVTNNPFLQCNGMDEILALFITIADSDLDLLRIYEEESTKKGVKTRAMDEIGYYHDELVRLERAYHTRFCPDKKISEWTL